MWGAFDAHGQDTRSLGMAGTSMALARGTDAPLWNPQKVAYLLTRHIALQQEDRPGE